MSNKPRNQWIAWALVSALAIGLAGCGGGGDGDGDGEVALNSSRLTSITVYLSSEAPPQEGLGSTYSVWGVNEDGVDDDVLIGTSDASGTTFSGDYDAYAIVTDEMNNIHLDAVKGSNGKYYVDFTTPELELTTGNTDVIATPTQLSYEFGNAPDNKGTSVGINLDGKYEGGFVLLNRRGFAK